MKQFFYLLKHWRPELPMASPTGNAVSPPSRGWLQWLSVAVLMIALFFGSSGTALAGERFDAGGTWIDHHPTVNEPWIRLRVMFYDPNGKDGFFLHDAEHGNNPGPAVYVDGQYVCSPDWQLAWPGSGSGSSDNVEKERGVEEWWGKSDCMSYTNTSADGQKYLVKFWNPGKSSAGQYTCYMYVYLGKYHVGATHKVKIRGRWRINDTSTDWEQVELTTNAFASPFSSAPTATMKDYANMQVSGVLNKTHGPTWVGTSDNAQWGSVTMTDPDALTKSQQYTYGTESYSNLALPFTRNDFWNSVDKPVEYVIKEKVNHADLPANERPDVSIYQWYRVWIPGFVKPKADPTFTPDLWNKKITISWEADESGNRSKNGTWSVYRGSTLVKSGIAYGSGTRNCIDTSSELAYDTEYTYTVYFIPNGTPSGTEPRSELSKQVKAKLQRPTEFFNNNNFKATDTYSNKIVVSWTHDPIANASTSNPCNLILERSLDKTNWSELATIPVKNPELTSGSYDDTNGLEIFTTYYYRLRVSVYGKDYVSGHASGQLAGMSKITSFSATRGTYTNVVKLKWEVEQVGNTTSYFTLSRRPLGTVGDKGWVELATLSGTNTAYSYDDESAQIGTFNEYMVSIWAMHEGKKVGGKDSKTDGFCLSTGIISGHVTYGTGVAVPNAKVTLKRQTEDGESGMHSLLFSGPGSGLVCESDTTTIKTLFEGDFSIQAYLNPDNNATDGMNINTAHYQFFNVLGLVNFNLKYYTSYGVNGPAYMPLIYVGSESYKKYDTTLLPANEWTHFTFVYDSNNKKGTVYLVRGDSLVSQTIESLNIDYTTSQTTNIGITRRGDNGTPNRTYRGNLDEFRFFTKALSEDEILHNYNHPLAGNEKDLAIYYPLDEGIPSQNLAYDFSKTNGVPNGRHSFTGDVTAKSSNVIPSEEQFSLMAYTDSIGDYVVAGIPFSGEGVNYSVIPTLGIHEFSPVRQSRFVSQQSLIHSGVDFEDVSSFPVSGTIYYANTDYPVEGVTFYVDGVKCSKEGEVLTSDDKGNFTISVPIGDHSITLEKHGHVFANDGRFPADPNGTGEKFTFDEAKDNMVFYDETLVNFTGRVVGGDKEGNHPVGFGLSNNNIGRARIQLTPTLDFRMNVVKKEEGTTSQWANNPDDLPVASATPLINSTAKRQGGQTKPECKIIIIDTDPNTGEFSAMLPPLEYEMAAIKLVKGGAEVGPKSNLDLRKAHITMSDTLYSEDGESYELYEYNTKLNQVYHSDPMFSVTQDGRTDGSFGISSYKITDDLGDLTINDIYSVSNGTVTYKYHDAPLFIKEDDYTFLLRGYEHYKNVDTNVEEDVPLADLVVTINNALSADQSVYVEDGTVEGKQVKAGEVVDLKPNQLQLDSLGCATYTWKAGMPNIAEPFTRTITMTYDINDRFYDWNGGKGLTGIVLGDLPTGNNFITAGPDKLLMILRDPPGTNSFAEWTTGSSTTTSRVRGNTFTENFGVKFNHKFGLTTQTIVGTPGVGNIIVADAKDELTVGAKMESSGENSWTRTTTTTATRAISTSAAPEYVGAQGDVYVGTSTNIIFGKARNLGFQRISGGNTADLGLEDIISTGVDFKTMFSYTQNYIENVLFPNFELLRKNLLTTVANQAAINSYVNNTDHMVYLTLLSPDDKDYGKSGTYKSFRPKGADPEAIFADSVKWVTSQINNWVGYLAQNDSAKVEAFADRETYIVDRNLSFDSGTSITSTMETENSVTNTWDWTVSAGIIAENTFGFAINEFGIECTMEDETMGGRHEVDEDGTSTTTSFSYTLAEDGDDDALSVDVLQFDAYGPIFRTRGGQTCCPYEGQVVTKYYQAGTTIMEATMQIEVPQINVDVPIINDVPTGSTADYTLRLSNASEIDEDVYYRLLVNDETNPNGANLMIDGKPVTDSRVIKVPAGQTVTKALQLKQTNTSILDYEDIELVLASQCQYDPTSTWDVIADTVKISAHFVPSSSDVHLALSNTLINTDTGTDLVLTFSGFDRNYRNLKAFRLQYKKQGSTDWTLLREYVLKSKDKTDNNYMLPSTGSSVSYTLPMENFSDGDYLFRVVSACTYGADEVYRYSDEIAVVKDMMRPRPLGQPEPTDGILDIGDDLSITFNETIIKGALTKEANFMVTGVLNGAEIDHETALSMQNTETTAQTEADIMLAGKDFSTDMWVNISSKGTILTHGMGADKLTIGTDASSKLVVGIGNKTYTSNKSIPKNKWVFLSLSYHNNLSNGQLSASVASDAETITLFSAQNVVKYEGSGPLAVGKNQKGAIHELLLWDEAHDMVTALANRFVTKNPSTHNLIGYWKMNEGEGTTIRDYARNRHMTMPDETWYLNNVNKAISLTNQDYLKLVASDSPYSDNDDYAIELWMRAENQTGEAQIVQAGEVSLWLNEQGQLQLTGKGAYLPDGGTNNGAPAVTLATSSGKLNDNAWHHIALNVLRQGAAAVYVDGERKLTTNASNVGSISTDNILVGVRRKTFSAQAADYSYDRYFKGQVDEIRIWDATLNADQLLSNRKVRLTGSEDGLIYYYPFEKKQLDDYNQVVTVGTAEDISGSGHEAVSTASALTYVDEAPALRTKPTETNVNFNFVASDTEVVIEIDEDPAIIEGCTLNFTVRDVSDVNGNYSMPVVWSAFVNRNELAWKDDALSIEVPVNTSESMTATIVNKSGAQQMWTLSGMPSWLQASPEYGSTNPIGESEVTFTVSETTPVGKYEETIYLKGNNGIETPITISVRVTGEDPQWFVNASDYEGSMNVVGTIMFPAGPSNDAEDKLAAFIGDECRGVAQSKYNSRYDSYFVMLNVYGGPNDSGKEITFKAYDAATGVTYAVVSPSVNLNYSSNSVVGKNTDPVIFTAVDRLEQSQLLAAGWNWMSMYVKSDDMSVPTIFANIAEQTDMVKSKTLFMAHGAGKWYGNNIIMNNKEMYMAKMNEEQRLKVIGGKVDVTKEKIDIASGWNWIGYSGSRVISLTDALAELEAEDGDVIKSQRDFAMYDGYEWTGTLTALVPGEGYMYRSLASGTKSFHYPSAAVSGSGMRMPHRAPTNGDFDPIDHHLYPGNMNIIAQLYVNGSLAVNKELGVFQGSECRTSAVTDDSGYAFLTVPGESSCKLMFKVMGDDNKSMLSNERLDYVNDAIIGTLLNPYVVHINASDQVTGVAYLDGEVNVWPQRVENSVHVDSDRDIKQILIIDTAGQLVMSIEAPLGHENLINLSGCANGIYFVKVILSSGQPVVKRIVKG